MDQAPDKIQVISSPFRGAGRRPKGSLQRRVDVPGAVVPVVVETGEQIAARQYYVSLYLGRRLDKVAKKFARDGETWDQTMQKVLGWSATFEWDKQAAEFDALPDDLRAKKLAYYNACQIQLQMAVKLGENWKPDPETPGAIALDEGRATTNSLKETSVTLNNCAKTLSELEDSGSGDGGAKRGGGKNITNVIVNIRNG